MGSRPAHATIPTEWKEQRKPAVRAELERHRLLPAAKALYEDLAAGAEATGAKPGS
jgi:hypothetical protein